MESKELHLKLSKLFDELIEGKVTPRVANASANVAMKIILLAYLQAEYQQPVSLLGTNQKLINNG